jgi:hypothetical protein
VGSRNECGPLFLLRKMTVSITFNMTHKQIVIFYLKFLKFSQAKVAQVLGGGDTEDLGSRPVWANTSQDSISKIPEQNGLEVWFKQ